jgi:hypothetical protein
MEEEEKNTHGCMSSCSSTTTTVKPFRLCRYVVKERKESVAGAGAATGAALRRRRRRVQDLRDDEVEATVNSGGAWAFVSSVTVH